MRVRNRINVATYGPVNGRNINVLRRQFLLTLSFISHDTTRIRTWRFVRGVGVFCALSEDRRTHGPQIKHTTVAHISRARSIKTAIRIIQFIGTKGLRDNATVNPIISKEMGYLCGSFRPVNAGVVFARADPQKRRPVFSLFIPAKIRSCYIMLYNITLDLSIIR